MEDAQKFYELDKEAQQLKIHAEQTLIDRINTYRFDTLLDVGTGDGHLLDHFKGKRAIGLDYNDSMLRAAEKRGDKVIYGDITDKGLAEGYAGMFDIICSNYLFSELSGKDLERSFGNIERMLKQDGAFLFTMTDPRTRDIGEFPGYKLVFDEPYAYEKKDLLFTVLLQAKDGDYVDVGIRDIHQPLETYDALLENAGLSYVRTDIDGGLPYSYAVLYECRK